MLRRLTRSLGRALALGALLLVLGLSMTACGETASGLTGRYLDDTQTVAQALQQTLAGADGAPDQARARTLINDYVALYRPNASVNGLGSFTTMQTALNALAGHYANYANRPVPDALRQRIEKELQQAERNATRGA